SVDNRPKWIVAKPGVAAATAWGVVKVDNRWSTFRIIDGELSRVSRASPLEEGMLLPVLIESESGDLDLWVNTVSRPPDLVLAAALSKIENKPDASTVKGDGLLLYSFSGPTDRYPHGALGDLIEWTDLVVSSQDPLIEEVRFSLPTNEVFEGLYPLVADINGDGTDEIVTTVSSVSSGARLTVFGFDGVKLEIIAESKPIGSGFRWIHQIAVAPFGPDGEIEIAVVQTPHIGGIAQFYRHAGDKLELVASKAGGYMSHVNGSRDLDQAVAGDFDGDGAVELLVPSRDQQTLIALRRIGDSVEEVWELPLGSRLSSNLTVTESADGHLTLGAATEDGILHIWQ
ncbi:MAG: hypothetical protein V3T49_09800, partial [Dehalococcoidia bacterium]